MSKEKMTPAQFKTEFFPLFNEGRIWIDQHGELVGRASDGVVVSFGIFDFNIAGHASYFRAHPTPDMW